MPAFPASRQRRLRSTPQLRRWVRETRVHADSLVMPMFVRPGNKLRRPISSMPGIFQLSPDEALKEGEAILKAGVKAVLLFGIVEEKDPKGSAGYREDGPVQQVLQSLKTELPELLTIADVCLCDYTDHGHCGLIADRGGQPTVDNDSTLEVLSQIAGSMARSGADVIAPSDMMDGRVAKIRDELDAAGFKDTPILSYAVKYASAFYGPFREALDSAPKFGDRKSYQMDPANALEARREARQDVEEGADILMVKPALTSLDILRDLREQFDLPLAAYQVSGEYAAIKFAAREKAIDEAAAVLETWTAIRRAGAEIIVSYFAKEYAGLL